MGTLTATESTDVKGRTITTFILHDAVMKLRDMKEGEILEILTDTYEPIEHDIRAWCRMTANELVEVKTEAEGQRYYIRKGAPKDREHSFALIISDPGLEDLLSPLGFALGAALAGNEVHIYFQGPAVRVLTKGFKERLQGIGRFFSAFAQRELASAGHVPPQVKLKQLRNLGAQFYICGPSMERFGGKGELIFDDLPVVEYLTFIEVMNQADAHAFLQ